MDQKKAESYLSWYAKMDVPPIPIGPFDATRYLAAALEDCGLALTLIKCFTPEQALELWIAHNHSCNVRHMLPYYGAYAEIPQGAPVMPIATNIRLPKNIRKAYVEPTMMPDWEPEDGYSNIYWTNPRIFGPKALVDFGPPDWQLAARNKSVPLSWVPDDFKYLHHESKIVRHGRTNSHFLTAAQYNTCDKLDPSQPGVARYLLTKQMPFAELRRKIDPLTFFRHVPLDLLPPGEYGVFVLDIIQNRNTSEAKILEMLGPVLFQQRLFLELLI